MKSLSDRGEPISLMEPLVISSGSKYLKELTDLALELVARSASFRSSLPLAIQASLADTVRTMNCYYSNLIEGHDTRPIDIERALRGDYSTNPKKRNLQLEAKAHIEVQKWIDENILVLSEKNYSEDLILEIHRRFCSFLPEDLLWIKNPDTGEKIKIEPGSFRQQDVKVGTHIPISPGAIPRFITRFSKAYNSLGKTDSILSFASAHHRFLWIHPFLDGNGRVARLLSHAATYTTLNTGGMWSIARGLARNVGEYKEHLINCDLTRRNDLDGRGNLSEEAVAEFTKFFLKICIDQVNFMEKLMQPDLLRTRILLWAKEEIALSKLPVQALQILETVLYRGEIARSELSEILALTPRHSRRLVGTLIERGVLISDSPKAMLKLAFPVSLASRWMPNLFPD